MSEVAGVKKRGITVKIGRDEWAVWASGHGLGNRFLWAAARALWRDADSGGYGPPRKVKSLSADERRKREAFINQTVVVMAPTVRECWMSRVHGSYYADEDTNWYLELHDHPGKGRWPVTVWEAPLWQGGNE